VRLAIRLKTFKGVRLAIRLKTFKGVRLAMPLKISTRDSVLPPSSVALLRTSAKRSRPSSEDRRGAQSFSIQAGSSITWR